MPFWLTSLVKMELHLLQRVGIAARATKEEEEDEEEEEEAEGEEVAAAEEGGDKEEGEEGGLRMGCWGARRARAEKTDTTMRRTHGSNTSRRCVRHI